MTWPIILPLAGALLAVLLPRLAPRISVAAVVSVLVVDLVLARAVALDGPLEHRLGGWPPPLGIRLVLDGVGVLFLLLAAVVFLAVTAYATWYFAPPSGEFAAGGGRTSPSVAEPTPENARAPSTHRRGPAAPTAFWPLWLLLLASLDGLFITSDLFNMYVAIELLTLASVALVALTDDGPAIQAALRYLLASMVASLFLLLGISLLYAEFGLLDLEELANAISRGRTVGLAVPLVVVGLVIKAALFPFHFWLPPAHGSAFAPVSAVLSALVVKAPFLVLVRLMVGPFAGLVPTAVAGALGALGLVGIVWGSVRALQQPRLKLLIAYSTVAGVGYLILALSLAVADPSGPALRGALFFALAHGCAKAAMFLAAGAFVRSEGHDRIEDLAVPQRGAPLAVVAFGLGGLGVMGFPPGGGFLGKWLIGEAAARAGQWWALAGVVLGGLLAAVYIFRVLRRCFVGAGPESATMEAPAGMQWPALALAAIAVLLGIASAPALGLLP